jgi:pyruvate dehydrogenase E1 component beta subunit
MVHRALQAAEILAKDGIEAEVVDLRWLAPLDTATVIESVRRTGRLLIVEEGPARGGWGGSVGLAIAEHALDALDAPIRRLSGPDTPMPFAPHLEAAVVPSRDRIVAEARRLVGASH